MIKAFISRLRGQADNEVVRKLLGLPRWTLAQVAAAARDDATKCLKTIEFLALGDKEVAAIKAVLSTTVSSQEDATRISNQVTDIFSNFFVANNITEPDPLYDYRWHLAMIPQEQYAEALNSLNAVFERFASSRMVWIKSQLDAIQIEMKNDLAAKAAYDALTNTHGILNTITIGEA